jgi:glyoxylase-like metal-dependent hydrolase (beta-lactamase superfamily II)
MLVDTGLGVVPLRTHVALLTERPLEAVASHTHFDHIGGHHEFACRACHAAEAAILRHPTRAATWADRYVADGIFERLPPAPYRSDRYCIASAPATRLLWDGDVIDLGDRKFAVIHTPGHSPGGIALWEAASGILFSGDIVYDGELIEGESATEQQQYHRSMVRLHDLPVRIVHAGHYQSYDGARHRSIIRSWLDKRERA